ncbi:MAG: hypothetical protein HO274_11900 [Ferrovum myxofaciens]|uniref:hypothetical protein n=1 Tax=Ferrovum myxofaciens TaxID=416213 RepID=UPI0023555E2F|nr:hypothetical protein [Ferrovum myxofaciens]QKE39892.1 MAG: hypothetical protein HO274_11900 [Ferrovum myxofaciens]
MRLLLNDIVCQCALGQQSVARDIDTCEVTGVEQRNRHADFVRALLLITAPLRARYRLFLGVTDFWIDARQRS